MEILEIIKVPYYKKGKGIHIKKKNRGKFTEYCGGEVTNECILKAKKSKNPTLRKRATFALNARAWKHQEGGLLETVMNNKQLIPKHQRGKRIFLIEKAIQNFANTNFGKFLTGFGNALIAGDSGAGAAAASESGFKYNQDAGKWLHESAPEYYVPTLNEGDSYKNAIIIDKSKQHLYSYDENGKMVFNTPVSTGRNPGNKLKDGDYRTPTGKFSISRFEGNRDPKIFGAPEFWRLKTPGFSGFGIHGDAGYPELIGQPASHGCVRMPCDSIASFLQKANPRAGQTVCILDENGKY